MFRSIGSLFTLALVFAISQAFSQAIPSSRTIRHKGPFKHSSGMAFPEMVAGYPRTEIRVFGQGTEHISVGYDATDGTWSSMKSTVFVFPFPESNLHSLRLAFFDAAEAMAQQGHSDTLLTYETFTYRKEDYIIQGLVGVTTDQRDLVAMFQCGKWMFKVRVSAQGLDKEKRKGILTAFSDTFDLSRLVKDAPWNVKSLQIIMYSHIIPDDTLAICSMLGAVTHKAWALNNISKTELKAGVPGLHIRGFVGGLKILLMGWERSGKKTSPKATKQLEQIQRVVEAGYLDEYVYDGLARTVTGEVPSEERMLLYQEWRRQNLLTVNIYLPLYGLAYEK